MSDVAIRERLEYLRGEIEAERISYSEIAELQGLAEHIDPTDVQLRQWAGLPEFEEPAVNVTVDIGVTFTVIPTPGMLDQVLEAALARLMNDPAIFTLEDNHNVGIFRYEGDIDEAIEKAVPQ